MKQTSFLKVSRNQFDTHPASARRRSIWKHSANADRARAQPLALLRLLRRLRETKNTLRERNRVISVIR